ncbi:MAG TPA: hypothetical protein VGR97_10295 [Candidatus Acidoferrales bacterium]|nr:hypothetical protein [Candidatus Acidoferrales bacterium]
MLLREAPGHTVEESLFDVERARAIAESRATTNALLVVGLAVVAPLVAG